MIRIKTPGGYEIEATTSSEAIAVIQELEKKEVQIEIVMQTYEEDIICTNCHSTNTDAYEEDNQLHVYCIDCDYEYTLFSDENMRGEAD